MSRSITLTIRVAWGRDGKTRGRDRNEIDIVIMLVTMVTHSSRTY